MSDHRQQVAPNLWRVQRHDTDVVLWLAIHDGITLWSYCEAHARRWLETEALRDQQTLQQDLRLP